MIDPVIARRFNGQRMVQLRILSDRLRIEPRTIARWARRGIGGHRLVTISIGRHRTTTLEAFFDFIREIFDDPKLRRVAIIRRLDPGLWDDDDLDPDEVEDLINTLQVAVK